MLFNTNKKEQEESFFMQCKTLLRCCSVTLQARFWDQLRNSTDNEDIYEPMLNVTA